MAEKAVKLVIAIICCLYPFEDHAKVAEEVCRERERERAVDQVVVMLLDRTQKRYRCVLVPKEEK